MQRLHGLRPGMVAAAAFLSIHIIHANSTPIIQQQEDDRYLQACPPGLPSGICALDNLKNPYGYSACVNECVDASCCQPQDGQESPRLYCFIM